MSFHFILPLFQITSQVSLEPAPGLKTKSEVIVEVESIPDSIAAVGQIVGLLSRGKEKRGRSRNFRADLIA